MFEDDLTSHVLRCLVGENEIHRSLYSTVQYTTVQCSAVQYSTVQYYIIQYQLLAATRLASLVAIHSALS